MSLFKVQSRDIVLAELGHGPITELQVKLGRRVHNISASAAEPTRHPKVGNSLRQEVSCPPSLQHDSSLGSQED